MTEIRFTAEMYHCEPCSRKRGRLITDLVRHMKHPAVVQGRLVADEYWTCPHCLEPKFPANRSSKMPAKTAAMPTRPKKSRPRLIVSNP